MKVIIDEDIFAERKNIYKILIIKNIFTFQHNSQTDIATYGCFGDIQGMNDFCHINIS